MTFGCLFTLAWPKALIMRIIAYVCGVYGCIYGIMCSVKLSSIHHAIHSEDRRCPLWRGLLARTALIRSVCRLKSGLRTGSCRPATAAMTIPMSPSEPCSPLQESIIQMYSDAGSWYLIPSMKFMSMAQCCLLGFAVALLIYVILFVGDM